MELIIIVLVFGVLFLLYGLFQLKKDLKFNSIDYEEELYILTKDNDLQTEMIKTLSAKNKKLDSSLKLAEEKIKELIKIKEIQVNDPFTIKEVAPKKKRVYKKKDNK